MSRFLRVMMKTGGKKHDFENLKEFSYQIDKAVKADVTENDEDKTDQELSSWVKVTKSSFDEMKDLITKSNRVD